MGEWTEKSIPDQTGREVIVTGANTGIGFEAARALASKGASVTLACRDSRKARAALKNIRKATGTGSPCTTASLDLADLESVKDFATRYAEDHDHLDLLILNAGVMVPPARTTAQGFELQFGVNHLGHFALTGHLLPLLKASSNARVVVLSSTAAEFGSMNFEDLDFKERGYKAWPAYGQSKLANQLFARELQRKLKASGSGIVVTAAHPGWTATDLQRSHFLARFFNPFVAMKPPQGALPTLRAATDPAATGASYFGPDGLFHMRGYPTKVSMPKQALDKGAAKRLWKISEERTGVRYAFRK